MPFAPSLPYPSDHSSDPPTPSALQRMPSFAIEYSSHALCFGHDCSNIQKWCEVMNINAAVCLKNYVDAINGIFVYDIVAGTSFNAQNRSNAKTYFCFAFSSAFICFLFRDALSPFSSLPYRPCTATSAAAASLNCFSKNCRQRNYICKTKKMNHEDENKISDTDVKQP